MPWTTNYHAAAMRHLPAIGALVVGVVLGVCRADAQDLSGYSGPQLYQRFCAACHGPQGHGDGPVASDMNVEVPDITRIAKRRGGSFPVETIRRVIDGRDVHPAHGTRSMPVWGYEFRLANGTSGKTEQQADQLIDRLVLYIQSIQSR